MTGISNIIQLTRRPSSYEASITISQHDWCFLLEIHQLLSQGPSNSFSKGALSSYTNTSEERSQEEPESRCPGVLHPVRMAVVRTVWQQSVFDPVLGAQYFSYSFFLSFTSSLPPSLPPISHLRGAFPSVSALQYLLDGRMNVMCNKWLHIPLQS